MDFGAPHALSDRVGLRPEPFGAMAYHFDNRRLVFLKSNDLLALVHSLAEHPSVDAAVAAAAPGDDRRQAAYRAALASLAEADIIRPAAA